MNAACPACLRRSALLGHLGPRIASLRERPRPPRTREILALSDADLVAAVAGDHAADARRFLEEFDSDRAEASLEEAGLHAVCIHDERYPSALRSLGDAPSALYSTVAADRVGELTAGPVACVVGTRRASSYALGVGHELARGLAAAGITVVSGLALGVDAAAHTGALAGDGNTIAVLACGADRPYPRTNRALYQRVRERGAVISEMPPGHPAFRWSFPARNRIMAGLAALTVVVEAADASGSLITAEFAADLGREVGAVPGWVTSRMAAGSNRLLREGASVIRGAEDALDGLYGAGASPAPAAVPGIAERLCPELRRVLDGVESGEGTDCLASRAGITAAAVRAALGRLEQLGLVERDAFGAYQRAGR